MSALVAEVFDVGAAGLADTQAVETEQDGNDRAHRNSPGVLIEIPHL